MAPSSTAPITIEEFREAMPAHVRKNINPELVDTINTAIADPEAMAVYRENVIGLTSVMREGRFKMSDYLSAVKFVSHKLLGDTHTAAWAKTFPDRYNDMVQRGNTRSEIGAVTSRYAGSKLVILLMAQTMMPTHILNAPLYQQALNTQAHLMVNAKSEMVRTNAAANLLAILKPPEVQKVELSMGIKEDETIRALRETTMALSRLQQQMIAEGTASVRSIAQSKLIGHSDTADRILVNE